MGFTKQETFDLVFTHLFEQGKQATLPGTNQCRYRTEEGLKCAVGCLIPDAWYDPTLEMYCPRDGDGNEGNALNLLLRELGHDLRLCRDLQHAHDDGTWDESMGVVLMRMRDVATLHELRF